MRRPRDDALHGVIEPGKSQFRKFVAPNTMSNPKTMLAIEHLLPPSPKANISPHSFRVMVVTDLLSQNVPVQDVQYLAGHSAPSTTQVYDRRARRVTRNIVERISV